jgi:predicted nucleic acid-binding protein
MRPSIISPVNWQPRRALSEEVWRAVYDGVLGAVQIIADEVLIEVKSEAKVRIAARDVNDWPAIAVTILLDCSVWTEDKDFLGAGVATWTTATVELYLART